MQLIARVSDEPPRVDSIEVHRVILKVSIQVTFIATEWQPMMRNDRAMNDIPEVYNRIQIRGFESCCRKAISVQRVENKKNSVQLILCVHLLWQMNPNYQLNSKNSDWYWKSLEDLQALGQ